MKKIILNVFILFFILSSCQNKDDLLTDKKWILHSKFVTVYENGETNSYMEYYKKADEVLSFKFNNDGMIRIREDGGEKFATIKWSWRSKDKKYITLDKGKYYADYYILELNRKTFQISKSGQNPYEKMELLIFKHPDNKEWNDENVNLLNELSEKNKQ